MALSGQGGDELFGGYPAFADVPRLHTLMRRLAFLPVSRQGPGPGVVVGAPSAQREKLMDMFATDGSLLELYLQRRCAMSNSQLAALGLAPGA